MAQEATLFRQRGVAERAQQRQDLEEQWKAEHMSGKRKYSDYQLEDDGMHIGYEGIETEVVAEMKEVPSRCRLALTRKQLEDFKQESKEDEEQVMK